jgi:RNA polymerase sigma factor (sigma-70 family)
LNLTEGSPKAKKYWSEIEKILDRHIKQHLIDHYSDQILKKFQPKINYLVNKYLTTLPYHVRESDGDDITNIAKIEFFETIKAWDPKKSTDVWPLAYSRITGAMRDQIRFITKASPTRMYDWITDAAYLYMTVEQDKEFEHKIDSGVVLGEAMKQLNRKERFIIFNRFKHDFTFKEIGEKIGLSESQVTRVYKLALKKLKKIIEHN